MAPKRKQTQSDAIRIPPQSLDAEISVLGGILINNRAIDKVLDVITRDDFYKEAHRKIFSAMVNLTERREPVDYLTLAEELKQKSQLEEIGGEGYLASLTDAVPTSANIAFHAKIVYEKAVLRRLIDCASDVANMGYEADRSVETILDDAE
ncbi:MAG: replicative DNA helicase, partial [Deltaproteobacteria bacterium]|nr:replicative DNA helicase [Deltaproteobacteria bacterium]